jgi:hypothetical protein
MLEKNGFTLLADQVWKLVMLVILLFIPLAEIFIEIIFYMFLKPRKNLFSIHRLGEDNCVFVGFHPRFFCIKDQETRDILLKEKCRRDLYPLPSPSIMQAYKQVYNATKSSLAQWHSRLGHPSYYIVRQVVNNNSLPVSSDSINLSVCDACQQGKSHQFPYPNSSSISRCPLELVFSDVWGLAP